MKTALYRHFDAADTLLYVGISLSAVQRLSQHSDKPWFNAIARVEVQWLETREEALLAEAEAIATEKPVWNIQGNTGAQPRKVKYTGPVLRTVPPAPPPRPAPDPVAAPSWQVSDPKEPLVGMFFHTFDERGVLHYQGHVRAVDGDVVVAQLFDWFMGYPSDMQTFPKDFLYSDRCRLYSTIDAWRDWADSTAPERWERLRQARRQGAA